MPKSIAIVALALPLAAAAQNPLTRVGEVRQAIVARDATKAIALLDSIRAVAPAHPNVVFLSAHAYGLAGRTDDARAALRQLAAWDGRFLRAALRDTTVAHLRAEFPAVDSLVRTSEAPVSLGTSWASIAERDLIAEGTAYDPATRSVLVGSLNKHKVIAIAPDGSMTDRVAPNSSGLRSVAGIHVDTSRGTLWVTSNARYDTPTDSTPSALFAFDARTGAYRSRIAMPVGGRHFLNDITTTPDGTVYVTDSEAGKVWHARPGDAQLRELTTLGRVLAPNGITSSPNGAVLFVADADHVRALDTRTGEAWRIVAPSDASMSGIDGLAFQAGALIAHHPLSFWRIARYELTPDFRAIRSRRLIEANTPDSRTSTTGEIVGSSYVYIGNSQIDRMNLKTIDAATMDPIRMYRVALPLPAVRLDTALAQREFLAALRSLCGRAFRGTLTEGNASDSTMRRATLVMHVRSCSADEIRIPLHVGEDRSRTWVISATANGLRLKHDHRHADGTADAVTQYGGDTRVPGTATMQEFHADMHTASLIPAARANIWTVEVIPGRRFAYALRREGTDRRFRVEFDLTTPVTPPPAPWGH